MRRGGFDAGWSYYGLRALVLENRHLRLVVLPELGGKLYRILSKRDDVELLWQNPRMSPRRAPFGADFDNFFVGGWDHPFPTLEASTVGDETLPYVGELWSLPWDWRMVDARQSGTAIELAVESVILPARLCCVLELAGDEPSFSMHYRLEHIGSRPFSFMWGLHPCLALDDATRFHIPATKATVIQSPEYGVGRVGEHYRWPTLGLADGPWDVARALPPERGIYGLHELELDAGWFEIERAAGTRMRVEFPHDLYRVLYLWMVYGGWRGIHHAALEPWTGGGVRLQDAIDRGQARRLNPGEALEADIRVTVTSG